MFNKTKVLSLNIDVPCNLRHRHCRSERWKPSDLHGLANLNCRLGAPTTHAGEETPHLGKESATGMALPISSATVEGLRTDQDRDKVSRATARYSSARL